MERQNATSTFEVISFKTEYYINGIATIESINFTKGLLFVSVLVRRVGQLSCSDSYFL